MKRKTLIIIFCVSVILLIPPYIDLLIHKELAKSLVVALLFIASISGLHRVVNQK